MVHMHTRLPVPGHLPAAGRATRALLAEHLPPPLLTGRPFVTRSTDTELGSRRPGPRFTCPGRTWGCGSSLSGNRGQRGAPDSWLNEQARVDGRSCGADLGRWHLV